MHFDFECCILCSSVRLSWLRIFKYSFFLFFFLSTTGEKIKVFHYNSKFVCFSHYSISASCVLKICCRVYIHSACLLEQLTLCQQEMFLFIFRNIFILKSSLYDCNNIAASPFSFLLLIYLFFLPSFYIYLICVFIFEECFLQSAYSFVFMLQSNINRV